MKQYSGIKYSIQKLPEGLHILLELGGPFKNKLIKISANTEREIRNTIEQFYRA